MKKSSLIVICLVVLNLCAKAPSYAENAEEYYYKANMSLTSGQVNEAVRFYKLASQKKEGFFEAYLGLSIAYRELGDYDKAHEAILKVLEIKPDYYQVYYNLGLILEKQNKHTEALEAYEKFLGKVPGASRFTDTKQRISRIRASIK